MLRKNKGGLSFGGSMADCNWYQVKAMLKCGWQGTCLLDMFTMLVIGIVMKINEDKGEALQEYVKNFLIKHAPSHLWTHYWIYDSELDKWAKESPENRMIADKIRHKENSIKKAYEIYMLGCPYTKEQIAWFDKKNTQELEHQAELKNKKYKNKKCILD